MKLVLAVLLILQQCSAAMPYWYWYATDEEIANFENGRVPTLACPLGTYRDFARGHRQDGCIPCPPGRYGSSIHLVSPECSGACPKGTYLGKAGGKSAADCRPCPKGTFGDTLGLATRECSGRCSDLNSVKTKYFGTEEGLTSRSGCKECPEMSLDRQCDNKKAFLERYL